MILKKRCLIPADGFYRWRRSSEGGKGHNKPFYIHPKQVELFSFAGVRETWKDSNGQDLETYSIVTTEPNTEMSSVRNRMPVILHQEDETSWLTPSRTKREEIEPLLRPYQDDRLEIYEVSEDVNSTSRNDESLIRAAS